MQEAADMELLREYVQRNSEEAFARLVTRHVNLVYSAALRKTGNPHAAEEITQAVFILLARKAARLPDGTVLPGWLYQTARLTSASFLRTEVRRARREQEAGMESRSHEPGSEAWPQIAPMLEDAMGKLSEKERNAIALRFFESKSFQEIGTLVGASENAAKKRVSHGLEKLRAYFFKRGVVSTTAIIAGAISAYAIQAAPATLAKSVTAAAIAKGTTAGVATLTLINGTLKLMAWTKTRPAIVAGAAVLLTAGTGIVATKATHTLRAAQAADLRNGVETLQPQALLGQQIQQLQRERDEATNRLAVLAEENTRLKSAQASAELLRLRGEIGVLRQQLALVKAQASSPGMGLSRMMSDPAMRELIHQNELNMLKCNFGSLFKELKLTPEQTEKVIHSIGDLALKQVDKIYAVPQGTLSPDEIAQARAEREAELKEQLQPLLGEAGYARFKQFFEEIPAHATVDLLNGQLGANQLSGEQGERLLQLVKAEPFDLTRGVAGDLDPAFWGSQEYIDDHLLKVEETNQRIIEQARSFLAPEQLAALSAVLSEGISNRITQAAALIPKR